MKNTQTEKKSETSSLKCIKNNIEMQWYKSKSEAKRRQKLHWTGSGCKKNTCPLSSRYFILSYRWWFTNMVRATTNGGWRRQKSEHWMSLQQRGKYFSWHNGESFIRVDAGAMSINELSFSFLRRRCARTTPVYYTAVL